MNARGSGIGMTSDRTRRRLVQRLRDKGIVDERVLRAVGSVPRHLFMDEALASRAYEDTALPIGQNQTISQPFVVALMTQALIAHDPMRKVLEIGTGSGYQAAVLAQVVDQVFSVERIEKLYRSARRAFRSAGIRGIRVKHTDGFDGWPQQAPFDGVLVTAAPESLPIELLHQLRVGGVLIAPIGPTGRQRLVQAQRTAEGFQRQDMDWVSFVPMLAGTR